MTDGTFTAYLTNVIASGIDDLQTSHGPCTTVRFVVDHSDFDGQPRSAGGRADICADEYVAAPVATAPATHTFTLWATDAAGDVDPTPATWAWQVRRAPRPR